MSNASISHFRDHFPILEQEVNQRLLVYFDNAATTQKPRSVIDAIQHYYLRDNANIHRGAHTLAHRSTLIYEAARDAVQAFIHAAHREEIIFTSGTTDAINLVASTWGRKNVRHGDEIIIPVSEHHSNIVPWQLLAEACGAVIRPLSVLDDGTWNLEAFSEMLSERTKLVACNHISNALGTVNPIAEVIRMAHKVGAVVLVDGAQSVAHTHIDVQELDCDFFCFSAHKMYGPTGVGVLYGKRSILEEMPPFRGGGEMIRSVSFEGTTYNDLPFKFEAGTPHIEGVIGLGEAVRFMNSMGIDSMHACEQELLTHCTKQLSTIDGLRIYGSAPKKSAVISFTIEGVHHYDLGTLLDQQGIAVRTGHHCTEPLWNHYKIQGTTRASFAPYNTKEEVDRFIEALQKSINMLR
ncbi:MAG: aminotransferase class V-fold PLP-dependent enzyme [Flavobacteriales bacterium]